MRLWLLATLTVVLAAGVPAAAQEATPTDTLELTAEDPTAGSGSSSTVCGDLNFYQMGPGQAPSESEKAYTSRSTTTRSCFTVFLYESPGEFNVTGALPVTVFVGCDQPSELNAVGAVFTKNGKELSDGGTTAGPTCQPGSPIETSFEIEEPDNGSFAQGDLVGLNVTVFGDPGATENFHVLVGGETTSQLTVPGFEQAFVTEEDTETPDANETDPANETAIDEQAGDSSSDESNGVPSPGAAATVGLLAGLAAVVARRQ